MKQHRIINTFIMVSAQNGDRNGHVLVENQQTRLNDDNETPEATSKSRVYRTIVFFSFFSLGGLLGRRCVHMNYGNTCDVSCHVEPNFFSQFHGRGGKNYARNLKFH